MPFIRLLIAMVTGILLQWYCQCSFFILAIFVIIPIIISTIFLFIPSSKKYSLRWLQGFAILVLFTAAGALLVYAEDIRNDPKQIGFYYGQNDLVKATLIEPLTEKAKSYKTVAEVNTVLINDAWKNVAGKILIYFKKDSALKNLSYGSQIIFKKSLQTIANAGNPGEFDYKRYCLFQGIQQQVFLSANDFVVLNSKKINWLQSFLFSSKDYILQTLQQNIPGKKRAKRCRSFAHRLPR